MAIYKRPGSKYYWMKFYFDGQLIQQSTKCKNKGDAKTVESAYRTELALGKVGLKPKKDAPLFEKAADDFLNWVKTTKGETNTHRRYKFAADVLKTYFGKKRADRITSKDVESFIVWRRSQKSQKTGERLTSDAVNTELLVLKMIFRRLFEAGELRGNPAQKVKQLPASDFSFHVLTEIEEKTYLLAAPPPLQDVALMMLETGMRCDEVYRIRRNEVFLDRNYLQVTSGKTAAAVRRVYLSGKAKAILSYRLNKFKGEYVFPQNDVDGKPATKTLCIIHARTVAALGYSFRIYDCRHIFASRMLESGKVDLVTLAAMLGHNSLKMIMRYAHPSEASKEQAIRDYENARNEVKAKAS